MLLIEYFLKFDMVIAFVSLLTIIMLLILGIPIPKALLWVFIVSLIITVITLLLIRLNQSNNR